MKKELTLLFSRLQKLELDTQELVSKVPGQMSSTSISDLVDVGFMCREMAKIADVLRKALTGKQELVSRFLAAAAGAAAIQGNDLVLEGEMATGTADVVSKPKIPDPRTEDFAKLMRWIGVPEPLIQSDVLRPSFRSLQAELTRRLATGEKLPPGITVAYNDMLVVFRTKNRKTVTTSRGVTDNGDQEDF